METRTPQVHSFATTMNAKGTNDGGGIDEQLQMVMELMEERCQGRTSNEQVEAAVTDVLSGMIGSSSQTSKTEGKASSTTTDARSSTGATNSQKKSGLDRQQSNMIPTPESSFTTSAIEVDTEDYDDDENDNSEGPVKKKVKFSASSELPEHTESPASTPVCTLNGNTEDDDKIDKLEEESYQDQLSQVPMGKQGAQMMTTFGDGPKPIPESVSVALLGTRNCLQIAIWDARALRRTAKQTFAQAQKVRKGGGHGICSYGVDPNMIYRAMSGKDRLSYDPKCGFDVEQLRNLFPEEITAYSRWKDMRNEYEESRADDPASKKTEQEDNEEGETDDNNTLETDKGLTLGGHLRERASHFDMRTERMNKDWYLKFAQVRQGSFLPRGKRHRKSESHAQWDRKSSPSGRRPAGMWENMSAASVQFLHWLGFDPPALPPPNDETTQALAFLGYDFLGKIVEKAILLRNLRLKSNPDGADVSMELKRGEQLTPEDIGASLTHPEIRPVPLFGFEKPNQLPAGHLYFGPGFEERLELEIEELIANNKGKTLSEDEIKIRNEEAALFAKLAEPPKVTDSVNYLLEQAKEVDNPSEKNPADISSEGYKSH